MSVVSIVIKFINVVTPIALVVVFHFKCFALR